MGMFFQDPREPLQLFTKLEQENLFLIQNAQTNAAVCSFRWLFGGQSDVTLNPIA